jgi:heptose-I-phosphate ethanolaminephosphotransferase
MVAGTSGSSYVVALSDHSQQLFEIADSFGGHVATNGTQYMYDIPFFVWLSPEYKARHPEFSAALKQGTDRFWKMDDSLGHSIAELGHISFGGFQPEKSLFSSTYKTPDGRLGDGTDYFTLPGIAKR